MNTPYRTILIVACSLALSGASLFASVNDFARSDIANFNGHEGVTFVRFSSGGTPHGFAFAFDLSKGYRLRAWLGDNGTNNANRATVGEMAEQMCTAGLAPIAGINGDYFRTDTNIARPTGLTIAESRIVHGGWSAGDSTDYCYLAALGDGNLYHGRLDCAAGYPGGDPTASWQVNALGRKIRNAIRTNYCNYPVKAGEINPEGNLTGGEDFPTTIGNVADGSQPRVNYYHTLVGIGTNEVGVATNLVLWTADTTIGKPDAYRLMTGLGCNEVGELDGGGSSQLWAEAGEDAVFRGATTAHGGHVMKPRDTNPVRAVANGIFVLPPTAANPVVVSGANRYPDLDEALLAYTQYARDTLAIEGSAAVSSTNAVGSRSFTMPNPADAASIRSVAEPGWVGEAVATSAVGLYAIGWTTNAVFGIPWFSADAGGAGGSPVVAGGAWVPGREGLPAQVEGAWRIGTEDAVFAADEPRGGIVRVEISLSPVSGHLPGELPSLLAEAALRGDRAAITTVEEDDGSLSLRGLALVDGAPEWVELDGVRVDAARPEGSPYLLAAEFDLAGETPCVSYLAQIADGRQQGFVRLRFATGEAWLLCPGFPPRPEGEPPQLAGVIRFSGAADVFSLRGVCAGKAPHSKATVISVW